MAKRHPPSKSPLTLLALIPLLVIATGCAVLDYADGYYAQRQEAKFERLVADREYEAALLLLDRMENAEPDTSYKVRRQEVRELTEHFASEVELNAAAESGKGNFLAAIAQVEAALKKIPSNKELLRLHNELTGERDQLLAANKLEMLAEDAEHLFISLQYYREQAGFSKLSNTMNWQMKSIEDQLAALRPELIECGHRAIAIGNPEIAERCIEIADKVENTGEVEKLRVLLGFGKSPETGVKPQGIGNRKGTEPQLVYLVEKSKIKPAEAIKASFRELERLLDNNEFGKADKTLTELEKLPDLSTDVGKYRLKLEKAREKHIAEIMEKGLELYRQGKIKEARELWQQILTLDPDNQPALEKIARADKVLDSIRDLQKNRKE